MRLKNLSLSGFRGFPGEQVFDLDAEAIVVVGVNGSGKTSLFDAILWALTGSIERLSGDPRDVVSRYSATGEARVELEIERSGGSMRVVRRFDRSDHLTVAEDGGEVISGVAANAALIELLWPDGKSASDPNAALSRSLTRAMYLQQDVVREFVDSDDEQARFNVVSELVGVGRVTELQKATENSRKAWSEATNNQKRELDPIRSQMASFEDRIRRLSSSEVSPLADREFDRWVEAVADLVSKRQLSEVRKRTSEGVDRIISVLEALQRQDERRASTLGQLVSHLGTPRPEVIDDAPLQAQVHVTETLVAEASNQLRQAQEDVAVERRRQAELRDTAESLRALAQLALRHLGDRCPVCDQEYDVDATRQRLEAIAGQATDIAASVKGDPVSEAAAQLEGLQRRLADEQAQLRAAQAAVAAGLAWDQTAHSFAEELGLSDAADLDHAARNELSDLRERQGRVQDLRAAGEQILPTARTFRRGRPTIRGCIAAGQPHPRPGTAGGRD